VTAADVDDRAHVGKSYAAKTVGISMSDTLVIPSLKIFAYSGSSPRKSNMGLPAQHVDRRLPGLHRVGQTVPNAPNGR